MGGRQILTNSCLSSFPLYCMGFYGLQDGVHKKMDGVRSKFLWQGVEEKFRYHMANLRWFVDLRTKGVWGLIIQRL